MERLLGARGEEGDGGVRVWSARARRVGILNARPPPVGVRGGERDGRVDERRERLGAARGGDGGCNLGGVRAELAARDEAVLELRGRLDVELNLLARESANVRKRLLESAPSTGMPAMEPEKEQRLSDTLDKLQTDLQTAEAASTAAFERLDRSIGAAAEVSTGGGKLMPCKFDIEFVTKPGQTVHVVGTWCDWDVKRGLELKWSEGHRWVGTMPLKPGFNYEYKYCVLERVERKQPGDAPPYWPDYGFTEPTCITYKPGEVAMVVWQKGNNKAVALDSNVVNEGIKHVYCKDEWIPDPMNSPIQLIGEDGEVVQTVGSTKLLAQCVNRADEALAEARATKFPSCGS